MFPSKSITVWSGAGEGRFSVAICDSVVGKEELAGGSTTLSQLDMQGCLLQLVPGDV